MARGQCGRALAALSGTISSMGTFTCAIGNAFAHRLNEHPLKNLAVCSAVLLGIQAFLSPTALSQSYSSSQVAPDAGLDFAAVNRLIDEGALLPARARVEVLLKNSPGDWHVSLLAARLYRRMGLTGFAICPVRKCPGPQSRKQNIWSKPWLPCPSSSLQNLNTEAALTMARRAVELDDA